MNMLVTSNLRMLSNKYDIIPPAKSISELSRRYDKQNEEPDSFVGDISRKLRNIGISDTNKYKNTAYNISPDEFYEMIYGLELNTNSHIFNSLCNMLNKLLYDTYREGTSNTSHISCEYLKYKLLNDAFGGLDRLFVYGDDMDKFDRMFNREHYFLDKMLAYEFTDLAAYTINRSINTLKSRDVFKYFASMNQRKYDVLKEVFSNVHSDNMYVSDIKDQLLTNKNSRPELMRDTILYDLKQFIERS